MLENSCVTATRFEACHLGGSNIKNPGAAAEGAGAPPCLVMGLKQGHCNPVVGQQGGCGEACDATTDHNHAVFRQDRELIAAMLATTTEA
jgi:hypothetical protein